MTTISGVEVQDSRFVRAEVFGVPLLCTRTGNDPITPRALEISYDSNEGTVTRLVVRGPRASSGQVVSRIIHDLRTAPEWVRVAASCHKPLTVTRSSPYMALVWPYAFLEG